MLGGEAPKKGEGKNVECGTSKKKHPRIRATLLKKGRA